MVLLLYSTNTLALLGRIDPISTLISIIILFCYLICVYIHNRQERLQEYLRQHYNGELPVVCGVTMAEWVDLVGIVRTFY